MARPETEFCIRTSRRVNFQLECLAEVLCTAKTQTAAEFIWWTHRSSVSTTPKPNYGRQDIINEILHLACVNCRIHFSPPALRNLGCTQCITLLSTPFEWISSYPKLGSTHFSIHLYTSQKVIQRRDVQHCVGGSSLSSVLMSIHNYRQFCYNAIVAFSADFAL